MPSGVDICMSTLIVCFFFFNDTATTEIYTLSLHDALPISIMVVVLLLLVGTGSLFYTLGQRNSSQPGTTPTPGITPAPTRSEEHTSELQSRLHLVCRLLLEKKKDPTSPLGAVADVWPLSAC